MNTVKIGIYTKEEIQLLKNNYNIGKDNLCNLLDRNWESIRKKLDKLNLDYGKGWKYWSDEEINILKTSITLEEAILKLPNRNYNMILDKSFKLGINWTSWSEEEICILYEYYSILPTYDLLELLPKRTLQGIYIKANRLNLHRLKIEINLDELYDYYCNKGLLIKQIALIYSVNRKIIGKLIPNEWKLLKEVYIDKNYIVDLYLNNKLSLTQLANKFEVSINKIKNILISNNIKVRDAFEQNSKFIDDTFEIIDLYRNKKLSCSKIALIFNTTNNTIASLLHKNNIILRTQKEEIGGVNHHNWKGGISSENSIIRSSIEYREWRKLVFKRDNYICQCCGGKSGVNITAHHILNFSDYIELRFDINNGITLCDKCHNINKYGSFHHIYGTKNNTKEQLEEYIQRYKLGEFDDLRKKIS